MMKMRLFVAFEWNRSITRSRNCGHYCPHCLSTRNYQKLRFFGFQFLISHTEIMIKRKKNRQ
ncbi:unnamed protein product [Thelazia callipaeda]|uniref:DUF2655 domain-containing protein n=1 Tax=Thelazia callipaeda TaxID=103827 RepID=A0A0N5CRK3_THECL|nr:unnamed protein product [Thelazia callipaeda]